jgi:hypothetical protein
MLFTENKSVDYEKHKKHKKRKKHIKTVPVKTHILNCRNECSVTKATVG